MKHKIPVCPKHKCELHYTKTRYGVRYHCPFPKCTVACWGGRTSTPADDETRAARVRAHNEFDPLWRSGKYRRTKLYSMLSAFMKVPPSKCHIGMFDKEQAMRVMDFVHHLHEREQKKERS